MRIMFSALFAFASLILFGGISGCATGNHLSKTASPSTASVAQTAPPKHAPPTAPSPSAQNQQTRSRSFSAVEEALRKTKGSKVVLTRKLLKELLREEQRYQAKCERLTGQLEALKHIDTEEPKRIIQ